MNSPCRDGPGGGRPSEQILPGHGDQSKPCQGTGSASSPLLGELVPPRAGSRPWGPWQLLPPGINAVQHPLPRAGAGEGEPTGSRHEIAPPNPSLSPGAAQEGARSAASSSLLLCPSTAAELGESVGQRGGRAQVWAWWGAGCRPPGAAWGALSAAGTRSCRSPHRRQPPEQPLARADTPRCSRLMLIRTVRRKVGKQKKRETPLIKLKALSELAGRSVVCTDACVIKVHFKSTALTSGVLNRPVWWVHRGMATVPAIQGTPLQPRGPGGKASWGRGGTRRAKTTEQHSFPRTRNRFPAPC